MKCARCSDSFPKSKALLDHINNSVCTWKKVFELRKEGKEAEADRLVAKITGTYKPMSEEDKEKLRQYAEDHKEEIADKQKLKRMTKQAFERNIEKKNNKSK